MLNQLIVLASVGTDIPAPSPNWGGPGLIGLLAVTGWVMAVALVLCVLGGIVAAACIGLGRATSNGSLQEKGFQGLVGCGIGVAVAGVLVVVLNFVLNSFS